MRRADSDSPSARMTAAYLAPTGMTAAALDATAAAALAQTV